MACAACAGTPGRRRRGRRRGNLSRKNGRAR